MAPHSTLHTPPGLAASRLPVREPLGADSLSSVPGTYSRGPGFVTTFSPLPHRFKTFHNTCSKSKQYKRAGDEPSMASTFLKSEIWKNYSVNTLAREEIRLTKFFTEKLIYHLS